MKKILFLLLFVVTGAIAQERIKIRGQILVPDGDSREGITVFDKSSNAGTITDENGFFTLSVGLNDRVVFSALQYNDVVVIVDEGIIQNKGMRLELVENLTVLDNVTVRPYDLSGNISVDVGKVKTQSFNPIKATTIAEIENDYEIVADAQTSVRNEAIEGLNFQNGLNFVNIFRAIFQKSDHYKIDKNAIEPNVDVVLRKLYNDAFFQENMGLEIEEISPFVFYAEQEGLDASYFDRGRELELLEFLLEKSESYKKNRN
ncbi:hypothetical protein EAX61_14905 [Dokdonia sinensis]|uniref:Carboxypeptidase-like regulatory domain-containing protein n=1 Tax=Dokdonia sinensis TaxID=2479847 RepID=A0A3M0FUA3_9FLAO|nr:hypothetical protein [Dokdonia sinensis]RMB56370.1 hypothetical protein EAX61_14905 [Dokdonia sinensis]